MNMSSKRKTTQCLLALACSIIWSMQLSQTAAFSSNLVGRRASMKCTRSLSANQRVCYPYMSSSSNEEVSSTLQSQRLRKGRKRALLRKYTKAIALSTTLIYGPMASTPLARRVVGSTAHAAASTLAPSKGDYNFQDFKDVKKKLSLAPGANVQKYEEILERVEVEGDNALENMKPGELESTLIIGGTKEESAANGGKSGRVKKKASKKQAKKQQVSDWESDEFGFGDEEEDEFEGVMNIGTLSNKPSKGKGRSSSNDNTGKGGVVVTDRMAFNNYQESLGKTDHMKTIKKLSFYSIFPVGIITTIRGQIRAHKEKKKVKRGLALFEQEKKEYEEEMKKKGNRRDDDDDDDDDDDY